MYSRSLFSSARLCIMMTFIAVALSSFSIGLIPFMVEFKEGESNAMAYVIAIVFWGGFLGSLIATYLTKRTLYRYRETLIRKGYIERNKMIGIISFSKDWKMWILYGITIVGVILIITDIIFGYIPEKVMFPMMSITILSFAIHCVMDGKYYTVYKRMKEDVGNGTNR